MEKWKSHTLRGDRAFTRLELAVVLATLGLLAAITLPVLAGSRTHSEQANCFSNLRQIGHAFQLWANDHGDRNPWLTPWLEGGTAGTPNPLKNNASFQMGSISNELGTPKILVCPADQGVFGKPRVTAIDFSTTNFSGGFSTLGFRDAALSYTIGLHSFFEVPRSILSSDRNIRWSGLNNNCFTGVGNASYVTVPVAAWTNSIHVGTGNVLFNDGGVEKSSSSGLQQAIQEAKGDVRTLHFLAPN
jgi:type II secretory pathway pseudopilin PulG